MKNMKAEFKQSHRHSRFYAISLLTVMIIISSIFTGGLKVFITAVLVLDFIFLFYILLLKIM